MLLEYSPTRFLLSLMLLCRLLLKLLLCAYLYSCCLSSHNLVCVYCVSLSSHV